MQTAIFPAVSTAHQHPVEATSLQILCYLPNSIHQIASCLLCAAPLTCLSPWSVIVDSAEMMNIKKLHGTVLVPILPCLQQASAPDTSHGPDPSGPDKTHRHSPSDAFAYCCSPSKTLFVWLILPLSACKVVALCWKSSITTVVVLAGPERNQQSD